MRRSSAIAAILAILAIPVGVNAAESGVDPHASSPAGAVYEIPLETARRDGAPKRKATGGGDTNSNSNAPGAVSGGGSSGGGGAGGGGVLPQDSAIKSENGYGSSSQVPGLSAKKATAVAATKAQNEAKTAASDDASVSAGRTSAPVDSIPSESASYGLVLMIVLGGAAAGVLAAGAIRRSLGA